MLPVHAEIHSSVLQCIFTFIYLSQLFLQQSLYYYVKKNANSYSLLCNKSYYLIASLTSILIPVISQKFVCKYNNWYLVQLILIRICHLWLILDIYWKYWIYTENI